MYAVEPSFIETVKIRKIGIWSFLTCHLLIRLVVQKISINISDSILRVRARWEFKGQTLLTEIMKIVIRLLKFTVFGEGEVGTTSQMDPIYCSCHKRWLCYCVLRIPLSRNSHRETVVYYVQGRGMDGYRHKSADTK